MGNSTSAAHRGKIGGGLGDVGKDAPTGEEQDRAGNGQQGESGALHERSVVCSDVRVACVTTDYLPVPIPAASSIEGRTE